MNQLHGRIDIQFEVKGKNGVGTMRFKSARDGRRGMWETAEWSLETRDGRILKQKEKRVRVSIENVAK